MMLSDFMTVLLSHTKEFYADEQSLQPLVCMRCDDGNIKTAMVDLEHKDMLPALVSQLGALSYVFISEAWITFSEDSKEEILIIEGCSPDEHGIIIHLIIRDDDNNVIDLVESPLPKGNVFSRFNCYDKSKQTEILTNTIH